MKTKLILTAALILFPHLTAFSETPLPPQISVTGSAEVKVAPDEIGLSIGVETRHETMAEAKRQNDERIAKALSFIKSSGVKDKDVQTDFLSAEPNYDYYGVSRTNPVYFVVRKSIEIRLSKIQGFEGFVAGLLTNGITTIHGIDFRTTELRKHRDAARAMAIRAAREKADAMAAELGVRRGKVHNVSTDDWNGWRSGSWWGGRSSGMNRSQNAVQNEGASETTDSTLSIGQISVSASVNVSFLIE
jgi:uncharacterized protein